MSEIPKTLGKYQIRSVLGQGAMGVVYQGLDPDIQRLVAIKVMHAQLQSAEERRPFLERFRREAQAAARCSHPNIVTVYELGHEGDCDFIVMEYVQGAELKAFIDRGRRFSPAEALYITGEVLKALDAAHRHGIVHRDVKPANVILLKNGGVKVADFGVARTEESDLTVSGHMVGTPAYMSPEGLYGEPVDGRADIYSVGMVLLELMTGRKPTPQQRYTQPMEDFLLDVFREPVGRDLSPGHRYLLHRALQDDKARRFQDARTFLQALEKVRTGAVVDAGAAESLAESVSDRQSPTHGDQPFQWTDELLHKLERELVAQLGPLAKVLIKKAASLSQSPVELVNSLSRHIKEPAQREAFMAKARHCMALGHCSGDFTVLSTEVSAASALASGGESLADTLPPERLDGLARALAKHVGPLAPHLVQRHARRAFDLDQLHQALASSIPNAEERKVFLETVGG